MLGSGQVGTWERSDKLIFDIFSHVDFDRTDEIAIETLSPLLRSCLDYWLEIRGNRRYPAWRDVDMIQLPSSTLPLVTVIDVLWDLGPPINADKMRYRFWGTGHVNAKKIERTGTLVSEHSNRVSVVAREYLSVIETGEPKAFAKNIRIDKSQHVLRAVRQSTIRLPLSNDGARVDHVMSASEWQDLRA